METEVFGEYKLGEVEGRKVITKGGVVMEAEQCFRELVNAESLSTALIIELSRHMDIGAFIERYNNGEYDDVPD